MGIYGKFGIESILKITWFNSVLGVFFLTFSISIYHLRCNVKDDEEIYDDDEPEQTFIDVDYEDDDIV